MNEWMDAEQRVERAHELCNYGRWEDALRELRAAISINPHQGQWHFSLGMTLEVMERYNEAINAFIAAIDCDGESCDALNALGVNYTHVNRYQDAISCFERAEQLDRNDEASYSNRIITYARLGDHTAAERMFYIATELVEDDSRPYSNIAQSLLDRQMYDRAIVCLKQVLALDENDENVYFRLGGAYWGKGDFKKAYKWYIRQMREFPGDIDTLLAMGCLLLDMNRPMEASEKFRRVVEQDADNIEAHFHLGVLALRCRELDDARREFEMVLKLEPTRAEVCQKLALICIYQGNVARARDYLRSELKLKDSKRDVACRHELGQLLLDARMPLEAIEVYRRLVVKNPMDMRLQYQLAVALLTSGDLAQGTRVCQRALKKDRQHSIAMCNLVVAHIQLGNLRRSRYWVKRAVAADRGNKHAKRLRRRLRVIFFQRVIDRLITGHFCGNQGR